ncbi:hypothetical protein [Fulvimarina sp. MAC8]|uniref:hypothetical protein n=1 Tax=Fulvimarina sp. MAC8 TaxID=3162874 RepID=UPI0032EFCFDF
MKEIGTRGDALRYDMVKSELSQFSAYSLEIQRIVEDKPDMWEFRLASELLKHLNAKHFKRLDHLRRGLLYKTRSRVRETEVLDWLRDRVSIMGNLTPPLAALFDEITASLGPPGQEGDIDRIHDACLLLEENLANIVLHEEEVVFANLPEEAEPIKRLLMDAFGKPARQIAQLPEFLDETYELAMSPENEGKNISVRKTIIFDLPDRWEEKLTEETRKFLDETGQLNEEVW